MDYNYNQKFIDDYFKKLGDNQRTQLYNLNIQPNKQSHSIQFKQLIAFYNFKKKLNEDLSKDMSINNNQTIPNEINEKMCLIDKNWIQKWKKHVGYEEIKERCETYNINNRELNEDDYKWIEPIINKNSKENYLSTLDNSKIFNNNEINVMANFIIINEECYKLFSIGSKNEKKELINKYYTIKIFKEKLILKIKENIYLIIFKENITKIFFELLVIFKEKNSILNTILHYIEKDDINEWIKKMKIELFSDINKKIDKYGITFDIINKTLYSIREKNCRNTIVPSIKGAEEILNVNIGTISKDLKDKIKAKMTKTIMQMNDNNKNKQNINKSYNEIKISENGNQNTGLMLNNIFTDKNKIMNENSNDKKPITYINKNRNMVNDIDEEMEKYINTKQNNIQLNNYYQNNYDSTNNQNKNLISNDKDNMPSTNNPHISTGISLQNNSILNQNNTNNFDNNNQNNQIDNINNNNMTSNNETLKVILQSENNNKNNILNNSNNNNKIQNYYNLFDNNDVNMIQKLSGNTTDLINQVNFKNHFIKDSDNNNKYNSYYYQSTIILF